MTSDKLPEPPENALIMNIKITKPEPFEYSAINDGETCLVCKNADGQRSDHPSGLPTAPNPQCTSPAGCRCMIVEIND